LGAQLTPASGVCLTISGNFCEVRCTGGSLKVNPQAAVTGVDVTGNFCYLHDIRVNCNGTGTIGFDITGEGCALNNCRCANPTTAAFKIQNDKIILWDCCTGGNTSSIGF